MAATGKRSDVIGVYRKGLIVALQGLFMLGKCFVCLAQPEMQVSILRPQSEHFSVADKGFLMTAHHAEGIA